MVKYYTERRNMLFEKCPVGCDSRLVESGIVIPECTLLRCTSCEQLVSNAGEKLYRETMKRFDNIGGIDTNPRAHLRRLSRIRHYWKNAPGMTRVLDVGSSFGMFMRILKADGYKAVGVEPSRSAAAKCIDDGLEVHCGVLEDIHFPQDNFDVITLYEVIEHVLAPRLLLQECFRTLKPGGMVFITTGNTDSWSVKFLRGRWDYFSMEDGGQGHISFFNPRSIRKLALDIGFKVISVESRRVSVVNKKYHHGLKYFLGKIAQEMLSAAARKMNKGHDMLVVLGR
jgi:2-polyprenyl-3-methyl-5-hydroxy-6-metoxy-1,4-benzoquinol methylase